jgi:tetratricopeptide (TPR) repeat protein
LGRFELSFYFQYVIIPLRTDEEARITDSVKFLDRKPAAASGQNGLHPGPLRRQRHIALSNKMTEKQTTEFFNPAILSYLIAAGILIGYLLLALWFPIAYIWATYENLYGEWLQVGLWLLTAIVATACAWRRDHFRLFCGALALAALYVLLEEISWGQQLFNWQSPDFFLRNNLQHETNIHNLLTGPFSTTLKDTIRILLGTGLWAYGILYPILLNRENGIARRARILGIAPPPSFAWPFFFFGGLFELGLFDFNEAEVAEVMIAAGFLITVLNYWHRLLPGDLAVNQSKAAFSMAQTFVIALLFAGMMTSVTLAKYSTRERALQRVENGIESFGGRYAAYERWDITIALYRRTIRERPNKISVYRDLADAYRQTGQEELAVETLRSALPIDRQRLETNPNDEAAHRSIAQTLIMLGELELASTHSKRALNIAQEQVRQNPDEAEAWFSLALSYDLLGQPSEAFDAVSRAYKIRPDSLTYRKVFYRLQSRLINRNAMPNQQ